MQGWMAAALNILLDLGTLIVPLPDVYRLSLSLRKKIQITLMFSIGFLYVDDPLRVLLIKLLMYP